MVIRAVLVQVCLLLAAFIAGCGGGQRGDRSSDVGVPPGFFVEAETPENLQVLSFTPEASLLTCTAFFASDLTYLRWASDLPPPADLAPIAVLASRNGQEAICLVPPDGSWVRPITSQDFRCVHPTWSPDGTHMAVSRRPKPGDLWVMNAAGGSRRRITDTPEHAGAAAWRPTGGRLAFRYGTDLAFDIFTTKLAGGGWRELTSTPHFDRAPEWSPDGRELVFASNRDGNYDIYIMDAAEQQVRRVTQDPRPDLAPAWSPDGTRILFTSYRTGNGDLYVIHTDGSNPTRLTDDPGKDAHADWSPDGQKVCYRYQPAPGESCLRTINADGSGKRTLLGFPEYKIGCVAWIVRRSKRIFIGRHGDDAGFNPPLGNRAQAVVVMHDDRSVRSVVGIRTGGATPVEVFRSARAASALLRVRSGTRLQVIEGLWMGQPATVHLDYVAGARRCRIALDGATGHVTTVVAR